MNVSLTVEDILNELDERRKAFFQSLLKHYEGVEEKRARVVELLRAFALKAYDRVATILGGFAPEDQLAICRHSNGLLQVRVTKDPGGKPCLGYHVLTT